MKHTTLKIAIASALAFTGTAQAHLLSDGTTGGTGPIATLAQEIDYSDNASPINTAALGTTIETELGLGLSSGQQRYIRIDLVGGDFAVAPAVADFSDLVTPFDNVVIANSTDTCVLYQVTGAAGGHSESDMVGWDLPKISIADNVAGVQASYRVFETVGAGTCAIDEPGSGLAVDGTVTGDLFKMGPSISSTIESIITTAEVDSLYHTTDGASTGDDISVNLANVVLGVDSVNVVNGITGLGVLPGDLINTPADAADLVISGDFTALGTGTVTLVNGNCSAPTVVVAADPVVADTATFAGLALLTSSGFSALYPGGLNLCYNVEADGVQSLLAYQSSEYTASIENIDAASGVIIPEIPTVAAGEVRRDGVILRAAFMQGLDGNTTFMNLVNVGNVDVDYTTTCYSKTAAPAVLATKVIEAGKTVRTGWNDVGCPAAQAYNAIEVVTTAKPGKLNGSIVREDTSTGASGITNMVGNAID